jgi:hypothetical protein
MNAIMIPIFLFSSLVTGIQVAPDKVIDSTIIMSGTKADKDYLAFTADKFILLKTLVEAKANNCQAAIKDSIAVCQYQLDTCHSTCDSNPDYYKQTIAMLGHEVDKKTLEIKRLDNNNKILKYTAIVAGTLALSASTYIIIK